MRVRPQPPSLPTNPLSALKVTRGLRRRQLLLVVAAASALPAIEVIADSAPGLNLGAPVVPAQPPGYLFFAPAEAAFIDAALGRLIPADALGPGAVEAGVTLFIDRQLAGPFGRASDWYMAGPWAEGTAEQGYQSPLPPAEVYRKAIEAIDEHARQGAGKVFAALAPLAQDDLLHALEEGKVDLSGVSAKSFFALLWQNTQEGFLADPLYEGNRGFVGWKLLGYPGPRYNYVGAIRRYGERYPLPTVGLMGRDPARRPQRTT